MNSQKNNRNPGRFAAEEPGFDLVHARLLRFLPELVAELGGDLSRLLAEADIAGDVIGLAPSRLTYRQAIRLLEQAANGLECPDFGMRLALRQSGGGSFGPLGRVMRNSRTFGDALEYVRRHIHAHSLAARVWLRPLPEEGLVFSGHDILLDNAASRAQAMEQILLIGHLEAINMTAGHARARRVHFRHQPISAPQTYRRYFGCEVRFGEAADGVAFSAEDLACPISRPDPRTFAALTGYIDRRFTRQHPPLHAEVRGLIMRRLASRDCRNEDIARALNLHVRTLARRLRDEGTSFQRIKEEVRRDVMRYYLERTDLDLATISEKLGFSEQSIMTRCCNRWFAVSPSRLRATMRASA